MMLQETVKIDENTLLLKYKSDDDVYLNNTKKYDSVEKYHYEKIKEFIYNSNDASYDISLENINNITIKNQIDSIRKNFLLELRIETLDNKPIIIYDNANKKLITSYYDLPKDVLDYITLLDKITMHCSNYTYKKNGECVIEHLQTINRNINGLEIEDEEKGEYYIDFEYNRYGGEKNQSFDYSSVTISASLDGIELINKIINPVFRNYKISKIIPIKYELKIFKTDIYVWGEKE